MQGQEKTWLQDEVPSNIEIIHFHGPPPSRTIQVLDRIHERVRWKNRYVHRVQAQIDSLLLRPWLQRIPNSSTSQILKTSHDSIQIDFVDTYLTYRWKFLSLMSYFLNKTFHDFLFTTTTSSYVNLSVLSDRVKEFGEGDFYYGALPYPGAEFVSGSNRVLSRKTVEKILLNRRAWPPGTIEDVAIGKLLRDLGIIPKMIPILNIPSVETLIGIPDEQLKNYYHFRVKSGIHRNRLDVVVMKALHDRLRGLE